MVMISLIIFFGFIGFALLILIITNKVASKYLDGDFLEDFPDDEILDVLIENTEDAEEKDELVATETTDLQEPTTDRSRGEITPYEMLSNKTALTRIKEEGFVHVFASRAKVKLSFEYNKVSNIIIGCVLSIEGLSSTEDKTCPDDVCFHVKLTPITRKYKTKTKWKKACSKVLALSFKLGPLQDNVDHKSNVCLRLYGKKKGFPAKAKCFGECFVPLSKITESEGVLELEQRILPKTTSTIETESPVLSTDSEKE